MINPVPHKNEATLILWDTVYIEHIAYTLNTKQLFS